MALNIRIPREYRPTLLAAFNLGQEERHQQLEALRSLSLEDVLGLTASSPDSEEPEIHQLVRALLGVYKMLDDTESSSVEVARSLVKNMMDTEVLDTDTTSEEQKRFESYISELLSFSDTIGLASRASNVFVDHERPFASVRFLSDIRPIFPADDVAGGPRAAAIVHQLRIRYRHNGEMEDMSFALDASDLCTLKNEVERAMMKHHKLVEVLQNADIPVVFSDLPLTAS